MLSPSACFSHPSRRCPPVEVSAPQTQIPSVSSVASVTSVRCFPLPAVSRTGAGGVLRDLCTMLSPWRVFPAPSNFNAMNPIQWLRDKCRQLLQLKDTSHSIALGAAIGMFFGFVPLWGFKTLLALGVCRLLRGNLLATAIAATLHDVALPSCRCCFAGNTTSVTG